MEGISHFLYLIWNVESGRSVSLFELELQAEVDKYIAALYLFDCGNDKTNTQYVYQRLFSNFKFDDKLTGSELRRYVDANFYASQYCAELRDRFFHAAPFDPVMKELRRFYRFSHHRKIDHIKRSSYKQRK